MFKTIMSIIEQKDNTEFGKEIRMHFLYLIKDGEIPIYAGRSYGPISRIRQHLGLDGRFGPYSKDDLGNIYFDEKPASLDWEVTLYTIEDCMDMVMKRIDPRMHWYNEGAYLDPSGLEGAIDLAEESLILENRPCLNRRLNIDPMPLPAHYKCMNRKISSSTYLDL